MGQRYTCGLTLEVPNVVESRICELIKCDCWQSANFANTLTAIAYFSACTTQPYNRAPIRRPWVQQYVIFIELYLFTPA